MKLLKQKYSYMPGGGGGDDDDVEPPQIDRAGF